MTRHISIRPVLNGFVCDIGCQQVVFESRPKLLVELGRYLENPQAVEAEYRKNAVNPIMEPVPAVNPAGVAEAPITACVPCVVAENAQTPTGLRR